MVTGAYWTRIGRRKDAIPRVAFFYQRRCVALIEPKAIAIDTTPWMTGFNLDQPLPVPIALPADHQANLVGTEPVLWRNDHAYSDSKRLMAIHCSPPIGFHVDLKTA
jgi:hypothetical protein